MILLLGPDGPTSSASSSPQESGGVPFNLTTVTFLPISEDRVGLALGLTLILMMVGLAKVGALRAAKSSSVGLSIDMIKMINATWRPWGIGKSQFQASFPDFLEAIPRFYQNFTT